MKTLRLIPIVALLCIFTGCASTQAKLSPAAKEILAGRYEWVTTTDSHIPKRVLKGTDPTQNGGSSPVAVFHGDRPRGMNR